MRTRFLMFLRARCVFVLNFDWFDFNFDVKLSVCCVFFCAEIEALRMGRWNIGIWKTYIS